MRNRNGFTLIEMIVVIAIVGILAAVILVGLGPSRDKARDARVMSDVNQVRVQAELEYSRSNQYDGLDGVSAVQELIADVGKYGGSLQVEGLGSAYRAWSGLPSTAGDSPQTVYCVDSVGRTYQGTSDPTLNSNPYECPTF